MIWFYTFALWPVGGFVGDLPSKVGTDERSIARAGQWTSTIFYLGLAFSVALVAPTVAFFTAAPWAGLVLARRLAARNGVPAELADLKANLNDALLFVAVPLVALNFALSRIFGTFPGDLITHGLAMASSVILIGTIAAAGMSHAQDRMTQDGLHQKWDEHLQQIFGVPADVLKTAAYQLLGDGTLLINPVPPALVAKFEDRAAVDAKFASLRPDYQLAEISDHMHAGIEPVSDFTRDRRASLKASGGLIAGIVTLDDEASPEHDFDSMAPLYISLDDDPVQA